MKALFLTGVVLVEGLEADAGALDDQLDGDVRVTAFGDQLTGGTKDPDALGIGGPGSGEAGRRFGERGAGGPAGK